MKTVTPQDIEAKLERLLWMVQKPGRYSGGEFNQIVKPWDEVTTHVALAFPDIYDIGVPNLGLAILYDILNQRPDVLAERAYCPWTDMETAMRSEGIPAYSLESKHPLVDFDILGITLPYETLYTNTLNLLDLAGIPLYSSERTEDHPLVIAGGNAAYNPEPMHAFIDAFVIGEGEEVMLELVDAYQAWKSSHAGRNQLLLDITHIEGVYVPALYDAHYDSAGAFSRLERKTEKAPRTILKRMLPELPPPVTRFIVPSVDVVHNRVAVEIMRGCTRGCRFCHAGMVNRPVRERSVAQIIQSIDAALGCTGYEEVALLSLSSSDYTHIVELVDAVTKKYEGRHLTLSLPSLRIESFSVDLMESLKGARSGGFTLAPEAATERMRQIINKPVSTEQLLETAKEIYSRGWSTLKLYFMIGHPSETIEDVQAIADLCKQVLAIGRKIRGGRAKVHAGVSTFIPKPHTPFQWVPCDSDEQIRQKQDLLKRQLRHPNLKLTWTAPEETMLEAWLSRGDRRMAEVIYAAWKKGARFDAWQDQFTPAAWMEAFAETGLRPEDYTHRPLDLQASLAWDHIQTGVNKKYLQEEYRRSLDGTLREDCRSGCYACGILPRFNEMRRTHPGELWKCPEVVSRT